MNFLSAFRGCVYALCLVSFSALAITGEIAPLAVLLGYLAFGAAAARERLRRLLPSHRTWTYISLLVLAICVHHILTYDVVNGIVYFFIYLQFQKLLGGLKNRDYPQLLAISFFQMVGSASMTFNFLYSVLFVLYLGLAAASLALLTCKRDADLAVNGVDSDRFVRNFRLGRRNAGSFAWTMVFIFLGTVMLFLYIPRLSATNFLNFQRQQHDNLTGFSDSVEFGEFAPINMDSTLVMRVIPKGQSRFLTRLKLRGLSLSYFDGKRWSKNRNVALDQRQDSERIYYYPRYEGFEMEGLGRPRGFRLHESELLPQRYTASIQLEPGGSPFLFTPDIPRILSTSVHLHKFIDGESGAVRLKGIPTTKLEYDVEWSEWSAEWDQLIETSMLIRRHPGQNTEGARNRRRKIYDDNLQLPVSYSENTTLRELARSIAGQEILPLNKAKLIETYLRDNFEYSLENPPIDPDRIVEEFLFRTKMGHCEYFATSMAILLRLQDVPARIVNGYYTDEFSPVGNYFVVRQEHAHAWVEVYEDGIGWVSFDPTPTGGVGSGRFEANPFIVRLGYFYDALKTKWYKYVVDYNYTIQQDTYRATGSAYRRAKELPLEASENRFVRSFFFVAAIGAFILLAAIAFNRIGRRAKTAESELANAWRRLRRDLRRMLAISTPDAALSDREILAAAQKARYRTEDIGRAVLLHEAAAFGALAISSEEIAGLKNLAREVRRDIRQSKKRS